MSQRLLKASSYWSPLVMFACSSIMVTVWIKHCPYLSSSTTDPPGWCMKAHWTPGPQRSGVGGGRSVGPQWCGSPLSSGGWAAAPPEALRHEVWSPPWGCWPSPARSSSQPCWKAAGVGERETCQSLLQKQWRLVSLVLYRLWSVAPLINEPKQASLITKYSWQR